MPTHAPPNTHKMVFWRQFSLFSLLWLIAGVPGLYPPAAAATATQTQAGEAHAKPTKPDQFPPHARSLEHQKPPRATNVAVARRPFENPPQPIPSLPRPSTGGSLPLQHPPLPCKSHPSVPLLAIPPCPISPPRKQHFQLLLLSPGPGGLEAGTGAVATRFGVAGRLLPYSKSHQEPLPCLVTAGCGSPHHTGEVLGHPPSARHLRAPGSSSPGRKAN